MAAKQERKFELVKELGSGSEGTTHLLKSPSGRTLIVRKTASKFMMDGKLPREVKILKEKLDPHPRIPVLLQYGIETDWLSRRENLLLYFEYCSGGDLSRYEGGGTDESFLWHVFEQVAEALAYLHHGYIGDAPDGRWPRGRWQQVVHRDIKPSNIFLKQPRTPQNPFPDVVLGDFGYATLDPISDTGGCIPFQPPETPRTTAAADVWALGATVHKMAHGRPPVDNPPPGWRGGWREWVMEKDAWRPQPLKRTYSKLLNACMVDCMQHDVKDRATSLVVFKGLRGHRLRQ